MMLLERREDKIVRVQADDWRTKAAKEARDAATANGQYAVLERQFVDIVAMCAAAQDYMLTTELGDLLATGDPSARYSGRKAIYGTRQARHAVAGSTDHLGLQVHRSAAPDFIAKQIAAWPRFTK